MELKPMTLAKLRTVNKNIVNMVTNHFKNNSTPDSSSLESEIVAKYSDFKDMGVPGGFPDAEVDVYLTAPWEYPVKTKDIAKAMDKSERSVEDYELIGVDVFVSAYKNDDVYDIKIEYGVSGKVIDEFDETEDYFDIPLPQLGSEFTMPVINPNSPQANDTFESDIKEAVKGTRLEFVEYIKGDVKNTVILKDSENMTNANMSVDIIHKSNPPKYFVNHTTLGVECFTMEDIAREIDNLSKLIDKQYPIDKYKGQNSYEVLRDHLKGTEYKVGPVESKGPGRAIMPIIGRVDSKTLLFIDKVSYNNIDTYHVVYNGNDKVCLTIGEVLDAVDVVINPPKDSSTLGVDKLTRDMDYYASKGANTFKIDGNNFILSKDNSTMFIDSFENYELSGKNDIDKFVSNINTSVFKVINDNKIDSNTTEVAKMLREKGFTSIQSRNNQVIAFFDFTSYGVKYSGFFKYTSTGDYSINYKSEVKDMKIVATVENTFTKNRIPNNAGGSIDFIFENLKKYKGDLTRVGEILDSLKTAISTANSLNEDAGKLLYDTLIKTKPYNVQYIGEGTPNSRVEFDIDIDNLNVHIKVYHDKKSDYRIYIDGAEVDKRNPLLSYLSRNRVTFDANTFGLDAPTLGHNILDKVESFAKVNNYEYKKSDKNKISVNIPLKNMYYDISIQSNINDTNVSITLKNLGDVRYPISDDVVNSINSLGYNFKRGKTIKWVITDRFNTADADLIYSKVTKLPLDLVNVQTGSDPFIDAKSYLAGTDLKVHTDTSTTVIYTGTYNGDEFYINLTKRDVTFSYNTDYNDDLLDREEALLSELKSKLSNFTIRNDVLEFVGGDVLSAVKELTNILKGDKVKMNSKSYNEVLNYLTENKYDVTSLSNFITADKVDSNNTYRINVEYRPSVDKLVLGLTLIDTKKINISSLQSLTKVTDTYYSKTLTCSNPVGDIADFEKLLKSNSSDSSKQKKVDAVIDKLKTLGFTVNGTFNTTKNTRDSLLQYKITLVNDVHKLFITVVDYKDSNDIGLNISFSDYAKFDLDKISKILTNFNIDKYGRTFDLSGDILKGLSNIKDLTSDIKSILKGRVAFNVDDFFSGLQKSNVMKPEEFSNSRAKFTISQISDTQYKIECTILDNLFTDLINNMLLDKGFTRVGDIYEKIVHPTFMDSGKEFEISSVKSSLKYIEALKTPISKNVSTLKDELLKLGFEYDGSDESFKNYVMFSYSRTISDKDYVKLELDIRQYNDNSGVDLIATFTNSTLLDITKIESILKSFNKSDIKKSRLFVSSSDDITYACYKDEFKGIIEIKDLVKNINNLLGGNKLTDKIESPINSRELTELAKHLKSRNFKLDKTIEGGNYYVNPCVMGGKYYIATVFIYDESYDGESSGYAVGFKDKNTGDYTASSFIKRCLPSYKVTSNNWFEPKNLARNSSFKDIEEVIKICILGDSLISDTSPQEFKNDKAKFTVSQEGDRLLIQCEILDNTYYSEISNMLIHKAYTEYKGVFSKYVKPLDMEAGREFEISRVKKNLDFMDYLKPKDTGVTNNITQGEPKVAHAKAEKKPKLVNIVEPEMRAQLDRLTVIANALSSQVDNDDDFTTIFLEEPKEFKKYKLPSVALALVCYDTTRTDLELKQTTLFKKFKSARGTCLVGKWFTTEVDGTPCKMCIFMDKEYEKTNPKEIKKLDRMVKMYEYVGDSFTHENINFILESVGSKYARLIKNGDTFIVSLDELKID